MHFLQSSNTNPAPNHLANSSITGNSKSPTSRIATMIQLSVRRPARDWCHTHICSTREREQLLARRRAASSSQWYRWFSFFFFFLIFLAAVLSLSGRVKFAEIWFYRGDWFSSGAVGGGERVFWWLGLCAGDFIAGTRSIGAGSGCVYDYLGVKVIDICLIFECLNIAEWTMKRNCV